MDEQQEIIQSIIGVNNIAIVMHDNPDSDAIGSAIALENALKQMNKQVTIITQNKIKKKYLDVFGKNRVNKINIPNDFFDILFVLDCSEECRINLDIRGYSNKIIVIDGGWPYDAERLISTVKKYGNRIKFSNGILVFFAILAFSPHKISSISNITFF